MLAGMVGGSMAILTIRVTNATLLDTQGGTGAGVAN